MSVNAPDPGEQPVAAASAVEEALAQMAVAETTVKLSVGHKPGIAELPPVKLERTSVERRVLGHVTDEVELTALGSRNTLAALTYSLVRDRNTTNPEDPTLPRLVIDGKPTAQVVQEVLDILVVLEGHGLVAQRADGSYEVTEAGHEELAN